ncbi:MAG: PD-(D/E)XK nuclease family protein [Synergistaceae bacterium]|nr:PD-(D/E)XK nuclease family protein [Synergistaceae bacterium]
MSNTCFVTVSDIALCQRCPALLAYKLHRREKSAWSVGIKGKDYYGSIFHKNISQAFFEAAYNEFNPLHKEIINSFGSPEKLESLVREKFFIPFAALNSENFTSGQLLAMASGVKVWVKAMSEFFREIKSPDKVFIKPEQILQSVYNMDEGNLIITGRYDALLFNPDKAEARLFEFKGYNKSDITVPLAQSLVYAWLINKKTGITPSIEIIYLDENNIEPDIFDSSSVAAMIKSNLPDLFFTVWQVISLKCKKFPDIRGDKKLCSECKYKPTCAQDRAVKFKTFKARRGASLLGVLIFSLLAVLVTAQIFFYSLQSVDSLAEEREIMSLRLSLQDMIRYGKEHLSSVPNKTGNIYYNTFRDNSKGGKYFTHTQNLVTLDIHNLDYSFGEDFNEEKYTSQKVYERIFPAMPGKYLLRAYAPVNDNNYLMIQEVVSNDTAKTTIFHEEVWYK